MASPFAWLQRQLDRSPGLFTGTFLSSIFVFLGVIGIIAFGPRVLRWHEAEAWPRAEGEVLSSAVVSTRGSRGGRTVRPVFEYRYTVEGVERRARGYDLLAVGTSDHAEANAILAAHPVGSRVELLVDPLDPANAVMTRGSGWHLLVFLVPPLFLGLGLCGAACTYAAWRGWFDARSQHPVGVVARAVLNRCGEGRTPYILFFTVIGITVLGLLVQGLRRGDPILILVAAVVAWGTWNAARPRGGRRGR